MPATFNAMSQGINTEEEPLENADLSFFGSRGGPDVKQHIVVNVEYSRVRISVADIRYIEGLKDYVRIHCTRQQRPILTRLSLKEIHNRLPPGHFIRIHKSFVVAVSKITAARRNRVWLSDRHLPVGKSFKNNVKRILI